MMTLDDVKTQLETKLVAKNCGTSVHFSDELIQTAIDAVEFKQKVLDFIDDYEGSHCIMLIKGIDLLEELKKAVGV